MTITLYDIPSTIVGNAWSPSTFKARMALNYKGLQYKTEWVEYPDIEPVVKKIGAAPTSENDDGSDCYTLPVIHDSATGKTISNSSTIVEYLDATYPDTPPLFPAGSRAALRLFERQFGRSIHSALVPLLMRCCCVRLNPVSEAFFRRTREKSFGCAMEEISPSGPRREEHWRTLRAGLDLFAGFLDKNDEGALLFLGDALSYADIIFASFLAWAQKLLEPEEWERLASWNGGRWGRIIDTTEKYRVV